ncbi:hypothetical protein [Pseudoalteromonas byunsanensis]|uniref:Uncharacterized protein n=1 Tax=Pseudoalteromonas byunsanensis TaxID=327939 RepID=A0A1S1N663_9GAMM|nr:hypothetical protein [Pseudoalteromonas byunsanensis]OHU95501.1 hypothetical protein BIW53_09725 [Pseudoalteromonas byunsanensis]
MKRYRSWLVLGTVALSGLIMWFNHEPLTSTQHVSATNKSIAAETSSEAPHSPKKLVEQSPAVIAKAQNMGADKINIDVIEVYIPPIGEPTHTQAYQGDLNDYEQYQTFGEAQERNLKQQYIDAAADKIKRLEALLARGRSEGITKEELAFAQEKIAGIKAMSEELRLELEDNTQ